MVRLLFAVLILIPILFSAKALAHPMDLASLTVTPTDDRLRFVLRLHELAVIRILKLEDRQTIKSELDNYARALFTTTLETNPVRLDGKLCQWARPDLFPVVDGDGSFVDLRVVAICSTSRFDPFFLQLDFPFLKNAPRQFQLLVKVEGLAHSSAPTIMNSVNSTAEIGKQVFISVGGFLLMGMGHIGVLPEEWRTPEGEFRTAEGLDHIFFLLAIIFASMSFIELLKSVTGFSIGHSLTLGLSAFQIIHVHSRWVEVTIAFSIAYSAGVALYHSRTLHRWWLTAIFGAIHGLGFASALQELQLAPAETWRALVGFNLGIELGQLVIVALVVPALYLLAQRSPQIYQKIHRTGTWGLLLMGSYWFVIRLLNALIAL
jgi:hypothetical protein